MKLAFLLLISFTLFYFGSLSFAQTGIHKPDILKPYQWQNRLILIFADSTEDSIYLEQLETLESYPFELEDRQLEIISIFQSNGFVYSYSINSKTEDITKTETLEFEAKTSNELRNYYAVNDSFGIILIGKDGGIKRRSSNVLDAWEFFDQIDTMPMRQREMSR